MVDKSCCGIDRKTVARCQWCGPIVSATFSCLLSLGAVELFPGVNRNEREKQKKKWQNKTKTRKFPSPHKKKLIWNVYILFVKKKKKIIFKKKGSSNSKKKRRGGGTNRKKNETNGCAPCWLLSLEQVVMLFPFLSVNISADILRLDEFSSFSRSI